MHYLVVDQIIIQDGSSEKKLICFQNYLDVMVKSALNWRLGPYDNHVAAQLAQMMCLPWSNTRLKLEIKAI